MLSREERLKGLINLAVTLGYIKDPALARDLDHVDWLLKQHLGVRQARINPHRIVGDRLYRIRLQKIMKRQQALDLINGELALVCEQAIPDQQTLYRIETGKQRLSYLQGVAAERALGIPCGSLAPWDYNPYAHAIALKDDPHGD